MMNNLSNWYCKTLLLGIVVLTQACAQSSKEGTCGYGDCDWNLMLDDNLSIDFALIPQGAEPLGRYVISQDFYMMTTEVTQGMFEHLMGYSSAEGFVQAYGAGQDIPAYYVNWHMAAAAANRLTQVHNVLLDDALQECYTCSNIESTEVQCAHAMDPYECSGYRLPTDTEWEYASRSTSMSEIWTGEGDELGGVPSLDICDVNVEVVDAVNNPPLSDFAWFCYTDQAQNVAQKSPNAFGLFDTAGNVWEWTTDHFGCHFPTSATANHCLNDATTRVGRGGAFSTFPYYLNVSGRFEASASRRDHSIGFRLLRGRL